MSLIYALIAHETTVLCEYSITSGNFAQIAQIILEKIPHNAQSPSKLTYVYDQYLFHYIVDENKMVFMCMADESFGRRIPFSFLSDIQLEFNQMYERDVVCNAPAYGMNEFGRKLADKIDYYNNDPESDRIRLVQGEIDQVKDVMVQNIEKVLERGERIDILVDKTDSLNMAAFQFKKRSTELKRKMWWKNTKITVILSVVCIIILYILICAGCGFPGWQQCFS